MKFKLDENVSPVLAALFLTAGHEAHSVVQQSLGGKPDADVLEICRSEGRVLVTLDVDFANIQAYPPAEHAGIIVLRLPSQAHRGNEAAVRRILASIERERVAGTLWIVEEHRIRIRE